MQLSLVFALVLTVAGCSGTEEAREDALDVPPRSELTAAVEHVLGHPGLLADVDRALVELGFEPAPADVARTLSELVTNVEEDTSAQHGLAASVVVLVEDGVVPELQAALERLGPEPDPARAAETVEAILVRVGG